MSAEEELLLPGVQGVQGAWGEMQAGGVQQDVYGQTDPYGQAYGQPDAYGQVHQDPYAQPDPYGQQLQPQEQPFPGAQQYAPMPPHSPGPHETDGRDSGAIDVGSVRASVPDGQATPAAGTASPGPAAAPNPPQRRPLHLGPPEPEPSGAVRPLSDRGIGNPATGPGQNPQSPQNPQNPAPANGAVPAPAAQHEAVPHEEPRPETAAPQGDFTLQQGPQTSGPEYLDIAHQNADSLPGPQLGALPPQNDEWASQAYWTEGAETVDHGQEPPNQAEPQLAAPVEEFGPAPDLSDAAGPGGTTETAPPVPDSGAAADAHTDQQPAAAETEGDVQQRRVDGSSNSSESTGNTWVSTPGSTAVEPIEPTADAPARSDVTEQGGDPSAQAEADTTGPGPVPVEDAGSADGPEDAEDIIVAEPGTPADVPGADAVAGIPAQQQSVPAPDGEINASQSEAGWQDAAAMVPRQGQHMDQGAEAAAGAEASASAEAEAEAGTETGHPLPVGADGPADVAAPSPDSEDGSDGDGEDAKLLTGAESVESAQPPAPTGPPAPGFADDEREAVHRLMRERRDIRNGFRSDPIPHEVLLRVLEAAHTAPSVGHSQPWDFVVIRSEETRRAMHELAERQRDAYAKSLPKGRAKQFKEMKIEAILDTPINIVVTADPTRGGRHTLGRHTQPQMAPYSSALAVENLWLAARAEGLGVGWVSFFDEREMVRALELPEHLEVVAYLCVGYVDEFPAEPELAQAGWSKRRPLSWVVHEESYGRRVLPGAEPQDLLSDTVAAIRPLDAKALGEAWERQKRMTKPSGALGMLEIISAQLCGLSRKCPPPLPEPAAVAVFAGDHGVHAQGVTPWPQEVTGQMVANFLSGGAVCNAFANQVGAEVCIIDVGVCGELPSIPGLLPRKVRAGTADMTQGPAMTREDALRAVEVGIETARDLVAAGNKALLTGEMGIANTTVSAALISACTGVDPNEVTGRGTGINDETHARKVEVVRRALELHQPDTADPLGLLAAVGGLEHAALVGLILGGASLRTPVILDGVSAGAAALVARCIAPEALAACIAGHRSSEPGHVVALNKLGLRPLVDLDLRLGEGTGALLSLPMVQSAARAMHEVATFDSAGVTGKA
ncbi:MAG TPA: nicotinate-nucleotide--dimethylbenzimidazole phosphoribosyltransferase [Streptomyces sp.]|nr:nicotinate-nucleotide--dimethylbenzimidazole phosphoribosyltransferase [Streptomyces sp.]